MSRTEVLWKDRFKAKFLGSRSNPSKNLQQVRPETPPEAIPTPSTTMNPAPNQHEPEPEKATDKLNETHVKSMSAEDVARILAARLPARTEEARVPALKLPTSQLDTDAAPERQPPSPVQATSPSNAGQNGTGTNIRMSFAILRCPSASADSPHFEANI